jgi:hypothetical protein
LILDVGANINLTDNDNFTAMDYAEDNNEITEMIIEASGEPEKYRNNGKHYITVFKYVKITTSFSG